MLHVWSSSPLAPSVGELMFTLSLLVGVVSAVVAFVLAARGRMSVSGALVLVLVAFVPYIGGVACLAALGRWVVLSGEGRALPDLAQRRHEAGSIAGTGL